MPGTSQGGGEEGGEACPREEADERVHDLGPGGAEEDPGPQPRAPQLGHLQDTGTQVEGDGARGEAEVLSIVIYTYLVI